MKFWYCKDFERVGIEKSAIERLVEEDGWFTLNSWSINALRLSVNGIITAHGTEYPVRLIYPDQFPLVPAWVEPQDSEVKWSSHQYGKGGPLCLELRPDNWLPEATGSDVLRSAYNLLNTENPLSSQDHGQVPSAHHVGDLQAYDWRENPVLIGSGCYDRIRNGSAINVSALRWMAEDDDVWPILVFDSEDSDKHWYPDTFDLGSQRFKLPVFIVSSEVPETIPTDRATFASALGIDMGSVPDADGLVVITVGEKDTVPFHSPKSESVIVRKWVLLSEELGARSGRRKEVNDKRVAIVGLGSVGSKIAEMLLRSGIDKLLLVDGDVFLPTNLERHILDWRDVGFRKVNAVKRRLLHIKPGANIDAKPINLNWQRSAKIHANIIDDLAECNLIVDATGDVPSSFQLGAISTENDKPFVSVEVFEGGLGALIARSLPGVDPTYITGRIAYCAFCDNENVEPPSSGRKTYEALTETGEPIVADDAAVTIAASHAVRVALDILDDRIETQGRAWLLIGCRNGWLFKGHGHMIGLDVGKSNPASETREDLDAHKFINDLVKEVINASSPSSGQCQISFCSTPAGR